MSEPLDSGGEETLPKSGDGKEARTGEISRPVKNSVNRVPALEVKFEGRDISPDKIFASDLAEVIRAVQRLATGLRPDDALPLPDEEKLRLVGVRRGSALFALAGPSPDVAGAHFRILGEVIESPERMGENDYLLRPVRILSRVSFQLKCQILIREPGRGGAVYARIGPETYGRLSRSVLVTGRTEFTGRVESVVGATRSKSGKCGLKVAFQQRPLISRVPDPALARTLGENLDKTVVASGEATWISSTWRVFSFRIDAVRTLEDGSLLEKIQAVREAGGNGWDRVPDIQAYLNGEDTPLIDRVDSPRLAERPLRYIDFE